MSLNDGTSYSILPQILSVLAVHIGACMMGGWISYPSLAIPKMMSNQTMGEEHLDVNFYSGSWIVSIFSIGNIVGCVLGGLLNQKLGTRKVYLFIVAPGATISWAMIALADQIWIILAARVLAGVTYGLVQASGKVYCAEIAHKNLRGTLGAFMGCMFAFGNMYTYITGYFIISWRMVAWLQLVPILVMGLSLLVIPESPYWLVERGKEKEAKESLIFFRGKDYGIEEELKEIVDKKKSKELRSLGVMKSLLSKRFLFAFLKLGLLMGLKDWAGTMVITGYMVSIFMESGISIEPELAPVLVSSLQLLFSIVSSIILRFTPRKPLFLICAFTISLSLFTLGTYYFLIKDLEEGDVASYGFIPILAVICVNAAYTIGFVNVGLILQAELFPTEIRSYASGLFGAVTAVNIFAVTKLYPYFLDVLGFHGTFWLYGGVMMVDFLYGCFIVPENRGESLVTTEDKMANTKPVDNNAFNMLKTDDIHGKTNISYN